MSDEPLLPDYGGACITQHRPRPARRRADDAPAWLPAGGARSRPGRAARARRPGLGPARRTAAPVAPTLGGHGRRADHHRRARPPPPPPSRRSPPGCRRASTASMGYRMAVDGEVLNVLRWTTAVGRRPPDDPARQAPAARRRSAASARPSSPGPSSPVRVHAGPPRRDALHRATARLGTLVAEVVRLRASGRAVRLRLLRGPRQGVPRVRPRRALRRGAALGSTASSPTSSSALPAGAVLVVTADHGQVEVRRRRPRAARRRAGARRHPVRRGPLPLAARPCAGAPARCSTPPAATTATSRGCAPASEAIAEGWFGPMVTDAAAGRLGDVAPGRQGHRRLRRPARHRALRPDRPPRLAHRGRDARSPPRRGGSLTHAPD